MPSPDSNVPCHDDRTHMVVRSPRNLDPSGVRIFELQFGLCSGGQSMKKSRFTEEQIVFALRQADEALANVWLSVSDRVRWSGGEGAALTLHRWRAEYGAFERTAAHRLREPHKDLGVQLRGGGDSGPWPTSSGDWSRIRWHRRHSLGRPAVIEVSRSTKSPR